MVLEVKVRKIVILATDLIPAILSASCFYEVAANHRSIMNEQMSNLVIGLIALLVLLLVHSLFSHRKLVLTENGIDDILQIRLFGRGFISLKENHIEWVNVDKFEKGFAGPLSHKEFRGRTIFFPFYRLYFCLDNK
jgi:hypothetical protein